MIARILRPSIALTLGGIVVAVCYFFLDRPVAWFAYTHRFYSDDFLYWPPLISDCVTYLVILGMIAVVIWRVRRPGGELQTLLLAISINLVATAAIKTFMKGALGRTEPQTWISNQMSQAAENIYGFHPFRFEEGYHSFPSGHAATTFAVISILWLSRPRWRWLYAVIGLLMCVALVGLNYHFVGDVIGGAMLGSFTGVYSARFFRLRPTD